MPLGPAAPPPPLPAPPFIHAPLSPPEFFVLPTPDPEAPPLAVLLPPAPPPFAPTWTALPATDAQFDVELQKYVSPPAVATAPPAPTAMATPDPGASDTFVAME